MKLKIKITQEVLEATKMCGINKFMLEDSTNDTKNQNCAITYACRKLFPDCCTGLTQIFGKFDDFEIANLPKKATDFIEQFDTSTPEERVKMKPFEFEVELTEEVLDLISIDQITKVLEKSTTLEIV